jgi:hypothetical protein
MVGGSGVRDGELKEGAAACAERHADADLVGALRDRIGKDPVNADSGKDQRKERKRAEQARVESRFGSGEEHDVVHERDRRGGLVPIGITERAPERRDGPRGSDDVLSTYDTWLRKNRWRTFVGPADLAIIGLQTTALSALS